MNYKVCCQGALLEIDEIPKAPLRTRRAHALSSCLLTGSFDFFHAASRENFFRIHPKRVIQSLSIHLLSNTN